MEELSKKNLSDISAGSLDPIAPTPEQARRALDNIGSICYKCDTYEWDWTFEGGPTLMNGTIYRFQFRCNCPGADGIKYFDYSSRMNKWHGSWFID